MELTEAFERVVLRHWILILCCVVLTGALAAAYETQRPPTYRASARLLLDASDPTSETASQALADTAKGLATAPTTVKEALSGLGVARDPIAVAQHVSVAPLGSSGVLMLSVTDASPAVARQLTNRLTESVIRTRIKIGSSRVNTEIAKLNGEIADLTQQIGHLSTNIDNLNAQLGSKGDPGSIASLTSRISAFRAKQNGLVANRDSLTSEEAALSASAALQPQASIIDLATSAVRVDALALPASIALALVLGLVIGITFAGLRETFRPTVGGRAALAREIGAPFLGSLPAPPWKDDARNVKVAAQHVRLAAIAAGADRVELIGADPALDLRPLTREMSSALGERARSGPEITVIDSLDEVAPITSRAKNARRRSALVLITPAIVRRSALQAILDYRSLSGLDLLGVVDYRRYRWSSDGEPSKHIPDMQHMTDTRSPEREVASNPSSAEEEAVNS